jgi:Tol biopolymer transport system component
MDPRSLLTALVAACAIAPPAGAEPAAPFRTGVVVTPRGFPNHTAADVADMFQLDARVGSFSVVRVTWSDPERLSSVRWMVELARQANLDPVVELSPFKADELKGAALDPPREVGGGRASFSNPKLADAYAEFVVEVAKLKPSYLAVATDVNLVALSDAKEFAAFAAVYRTLYERVKQTSPETKVFVTFQWDAMQGAKAQAGGQQLGALRPRLDLLAVTSDPVQLFRKTGPSGIPPDYYARIAGLRSGREEVFLEVNWPSDGASGEASQVEYIRALPGLLAPLAPTMVAWTFLHDVKVLVFTVRKGLISTDGTPKPAFAAFGALGGGRPAQAAAESRPAARSKGATPGYFTIYTARLDGTDLTPIISSPDREMTHPRVSPDGKRLVLTGYNARDKEGRATEEQGYEYTEIMVLDLDGTGLEVVVQPKPGVVAANGDWTPDGKGIIYISTDNPQRSPEIRQIDLQTRKVARLPTPAGIKASDPHRVAGKLVFPEKVGGRGADPLWVMNVDGSGARQVTRPPRSSSAPGLYGDFDPKLSPDGSKVAFMRIDGGDGWRVMVLDLATGEERSLTPKGVIEWQPTWSSDGRLLLFVHLDKQHLKDTGLYTMTPDGKQRTKVPLPPGYLYNHGYFFPGDGSSPKARIIFNATPKPWL